MLDAFTEVLVKNAAAKQQEDELTALMMKLPIEEVSKIASGQTKIGYMMDDDKNWLKKYEGTPLFDQAIALEEGLLAIEAERIAKRVNRPPEPDDLYTKEDMIRLKKRQLDLELHKGSLTSNKVEEEEEEEEEEEPEAALEPKAAEARFVQDLTSGINKKADIPGWTDADYAAVKNIPAEHRGSHQKTTAYLNSNPGGLSPAALKAYNSSLSQPSTVPWRTLPLKTPATVAMPQPKVAMMDQGMQPWGSRQAANTNVFKQLGGTINRLKSKNKPGLLETLSNVADAGKVASADKSVKSAGLSRIRRLSEAVTKKYKATGDIPEGLSKAIETAGTKNVRRTLGKGVSAEKYWAGKGGQHHQEWANKIEEEALKGASVKSAAASMAQWAKRAG